MSRIITYDQVKKFIEQEGYRLLSLDYKNAHTKMSVACDKGHLFEMNWNHFQRGDRCPQCAVVKRTDKLRHSYEYIKEQFNNKGYELLSTEYTKRSSKLDLKCPKGHVFQMTYGSFHNGRRCNVCANNQKLSYEQVKSFINNTGYSLLSNDYINNNELLSIECDKGHMFQMRYNAFHRGQRCPVCKGGIRLTYEHVKSQIEKEGYSLLSNNYKNALTPILLKCKNGHSFKMAYNCFQQGQRCPICSRTYSKAEKEIVNYIKIMYNGTIIENDRTQVINPLTGKNLELDIFLPECSKAIEYNGIYWHSLEYQRFKDELKIKQCKEKNIDLLVILEKDWMCDKESCLNQVKKFIEG